MFTWPEGPVPVGSVVSIFYDRAKGPLPQNAAVELKVGGWGSACMAGWPEGWLAGWRGGQEGRVAQPACMSALRCA